MVLGAVDAVDAVDAVEDVVVGDVGDVRDVGDGAAGADVVEPAEAEVGVLAVEVPAELGVTPEPNAGALLDPELVPEASPRALPIGIWYCLPAGEPGSMWTPEPGPAARADGDVTAAAPTTNITTTRRTTRTLATRGMRDALIPLR